MPTTTTGGGTIKPESRPSYQTNPKKSVTNVKTKVAVPKNKNKGAKPTDKPVVYEKGAKPKPK